VLQRAVLMVPGRRFEQEVKPRLRRRAFVARFADNALMAFRQDAEARRVLEGGLPKRFERFGRTLHPEKTRLAAFRGPEGQGQSARNTRAQLRPARLHPLLAALAEGALGGQAHDGQGPLRPGGASGESVVPATSPPAGGGTARGPEPPAARARGLLRHAGQRRGALALSLRGARVLAQVAELPLARVSPVLGGLSPPACPLPLPTLGVVHAVRSRRVCSTEGPDALIGHVRICGSRG
jgi:hypothetical protein